jgi:hypothetical protein
MEKLAKRFFECGTLCHQHSKTFHRATGRALDHLKRGTPISLESTSPTFTAASVQSSLHQIPVFFFTVLKKKKKNMSTCQCHIGVAFYSFPNFPIQWTLVLSESPDFNGYVWCGTVTETVNGFGESWTLSTSSLTTLNPMAVFLGIVHVSKSSLPLTTTKGMVTLENVNASQSSYPIGSEDYVVLALSHLCQSGAINLPDQKPQRISHSIRTVLVGLQQTPPRPGRGYLVMNL